MLNGIELRISFKISETKMELLYYVLTLRSSAICCLLNNCCSIAAVLISGLEVVGALALTLFSLGNWILN